MTITIIILAYILWLTDIIRMIIDKPSDLLISGALITLLSWQVSVAWGITMLCVSVFICIVAFIKALK